MSNEPLKKNQELSDINIKVIRSLDELSALSTDWHAICQTTLNTSPFATYAWIYPYLKTQPSNSWACAVAWSGECLIGVMPLEVGQFGARLLKSGQAALPNNYHLMACEPALFPFLGKLIFFRMLEAVFSYFNGHLAYLVLPDLGPECAEILLDKKSHPEFMVRTSINRSSSVISVPRTESDFDALLSKNGKRSLRKARNRLSADAKSVELRIIQGDSNDFCELLSFAQLENSGWKGKAGTAITQDPVLMALYKERVTELSQTGMLEWHFLVADDRRIAGHMALRLGSALTIWKVAFDENFSEYSPGMLLMEAMIRREIGEGASKYIDLVTDLPWHSIWQPQKIPRYSISFFPRHGWRGQLACGYFMSRMILKDSINWVRKEYRRRRR